MNRLFLDTPLSANQQIDLDPNQAHYLTTVMRMNVGDEIALFNGQDGEWVAEIMDAKKKRCTVSLRAQTRDQQGCPDLWLCFAPIKKQRLDFIIEKATELGVCALVPVITRHTIVSKVRADRLEAQAIEAAEQCERLTIPEIHEAIALQQLIKDWPKDRKLFVLDERGGALPIKDALLNQAPDTPAAILTGPEGGFEPSELDLLGNLPFVERISVGPRILRADTAALAAISCWQSVCGDWQAPLRNRFEES